MHMKQSIRLGASSEVPDKRDFEESKNIQGILKILENCKEIRRRGRHESSGTSDGCEELNSTPRM